MEGQAHGHGHGHAAEAPRGWHPADIEFIEAEINKQTKPLASRLDQLSTSLRAAGVKTETNGQKALRYAVTGTAIMALSIVANKLWNLAWGGSEEEMETPRGARARA